LTEPVQPTRVLVVDDERDIADTLVLILRMSGHAARAAYTAEEAIEVAPHFLPHAIITDVMMPGMSGVDLSVWFAEHYPDCKVLLVSGRNSAALLIEASRKGGNDHIILPKPVHPTEILAFVAACTPPA
jgi:DNA-binding response OmpR family regulator